MATFRVKYQTIEFGDVDIHVRILRDRQQFSDDQGKAEELGISSASWPIFGQVWPSGNVLAHHMFDYPLSGQRILEVGCGIGLSSLVLNHRQADITATDYHPEVEGFLDENAQLNKDEKIPFTRTGWDDNESELGLFDLIIGSDILYEREHIALLSAFINQHAKAKCTVILVDPGRGHHAQFSKKMITLGFEHSQKKLENVDYLAAPFKGQLLTYIRN
jgi:predicted nicotinamide N-methyase